MQSVSTSINDLKVIVSNFKIIGEAESISSYGSGHINDTYRVTNSQKHHPDYLLQKINSYVFKNVPLLIKNIELATGHIRQKLAGIKGSNPDKEVLTLIKTNTGEFFYTDANGSYWRMYLFLKDTVGHDLVTTTQQANEGGKAFGRFQALLSDIDAGTLTETIPDFHNIEKRLATFDAVLLNNPLGRAKDVVTEIEFVKKRAKSMSAILELGRTGKIPLRITHNDTKFNNVLLDKEDKAQCVIDLDTVMPGYVAYDFGDSIRTIVNHAAEDEADLSKIDVNLSFFEAFAQGFLQQTGNLLTTQEIESLPMGALLLPYIVGVRFLTDHLDGDNYFRTHFAGHNLQRARAQFQLLTRLEENYTGLQQIIQKVAAENRLLPNYTPINTNQLTIN